MCRLIVLIRFIAFRFPERVMLSWRKKKERCHCITLSANLHVGAQVAPQRCLILRHGQKQYYATIWICLLTSFFRHLCQFECNRDVCQTKRNTVVASTLANKLKKKIERISFPIPSCAAYIQVYDIFADRKRRRRGSKPADPPNPFARFALNCFD